MYMQLINIFTLAHGTCSQYDWTLIFGSICNCHRILYMAFRGGRGGFWFVCPHVPNPCFLHFESTLKLISTFIAQWTAFPTIHAWKRIDPKVLLGFLQSYASLPLFHWERQWAKMLCHSSAVKKARNSTFGNGLWCPELANALHLDILEWISNTELFCPTSVLGTGPAFLVQHFISTLYAWCTYKGKPHKISWWNCQD